MTFNFSGTVTTLNDPRSIFGGAVRVGDPFTGSFVYDTTTIDQESDPGVGFYLYANRTNTPNLPPIGLTIRLGTVAIQPNYANAFGVNTFNSQPTTLGFLADGFEARQPTSLDGASTISGSSTILALVDPTQSAFSSDALPPSLDISDYTLGIIRVVVPGLTPGSDSFVALEGTLDGLSPGVVPEPASLVMLSLGTVAVVGMAWRRRGVARP